jgi:hypothetical protein
MQELQTSLHCWSSICKGHNISEEAALQGSWFWCHIANKRREPMRWSSIRSSLCISDPWHRHKSNVIPISLTSLELVQNGVTCHLHLVLIWLAILLVYTQSVQFTIQFIKMQSSSSMFSSSHGSKCIVREKLVDDGLHKIERKWMHISLLNPPKMITWLKVTISRCELLYFFTACT